MRLSDYLDLSATTDVAFAACIGRSRTAVSRLRRGETRPDWETARRIAEVTNGAVTPNDFLPDAPPSPPAHTSTPAPFTEPTP